jgi:transcriptional regulator with XRE-family HTH domain
MTTTQHSAVATRIREEAKRQGISQAALAGTIGLTQQAVSRRLSGGAPISVIEAEQFAQALNVSVSWLFGETETREPVAAEAVTV